MSLLNHPRIGVVLSSGGARGAAHVGVLKVLESADIIPDVIVGASMGAELGGAYAAGVPLDRLEDLWRTTSVGRVAKSLFPTIPWSGWSSGNAIRRFLEDLCGNRAIENLPIRFGAVATDLQSGQPVTLSEGSLVEAIRASLSVPGLFSPVWLKYRLYVDGGVSNPLPVDAARELGAEFVIACDVLVDPSDVEFSGLPLRVGSGRLLGMTRSEARTSPETHPFAPSVFNVLFQMSTIFQKRLSEARLAEHPADVLMQPDFSSDPPCYRRVGCGIEAGERAATNALPEILRQLGRSREDKAEGERE